MLRPLTIATLIVLAGLAGAQERMPPPKAPPIDEVAGAVGLKDGQRASVQKILEQHHQAMQALHAAMRSKHDAIEQQTHASLAKVLTPQQLARFDQWRDEHRPPGGPDDRRGPQGRSGGPGMARPMGPGAGLYGPYAEQPGARDGGAGFAGRRPPMPPMPPDGPYAQDPRQPMPAGMGFDPQRRPPMPPGGPFAQNRRPPPPVMGYDEGPRPPPPPPRGWGSERGQANPYGRGQRPPPPPPPPEGDDDGQPFPPPGGQP